MSWFHWLVSVLALLGVILNIKKHPACFVIWAFTNASWAIIDFNYGLVSQASIQLIYFFLSIYGLKAWTKKKVNHACL